MQLLNMAEKFCQLKASCSTEEFCLRAEAVYLTQALEYANGLGYDELPNYSKLGFMLEKQIYERGHMPSSKFSWEPEDMMILFVEERARPRHGEENVEIENQE